MFAVPCASSPATAAVLKQVKDLPRRVYKVDVDVKDLQSNGGIQTVSVRVCECRNGVCVDQDRSSLLGSLGWLAMLLPLALLLLLCEFRTAAPCSPEQTQPSASRLPDVAVMRSPLGSDVSNTSL